jgi:ribosomal protein S18 acetylase RimI-like enzyme
VSPALGVVRATADDVDEGLDVLAEAAAWLRERGIEQWPRRFPRGQIQESVARGETYVARYGDVTAGTLALQWDDAFFWGERPPDAGYVHRVAVRRAFAGAGLGARLIEWADREAAACGRRYLRLDCMAENQRLRKYYERLGFEHRSDVERGAWRASLYERPCRSPTVDARPPAG